MLVLGIASSASAEPAEERLIPKLSGFSFGPQLGFNFAHTGGNGELRVDPASDELLFSTQAHLRAGGHITLARSRYALRVEAAYSGKGADVVGNVEELQGLPYEVRYKLRYLSFPVLGMVHVPYDGDLSPHFFLGPEFSVLLSSKVEGESVTVEPGGGTSQVNQSASLTEDSESFVMGGVVGAGMRFPAWRGAVTLDFRLSFDVTEAIPESDAMTAMGVSIRSRSLRSRVLTIAMGYEY